MNTHDIDIELPAEFRSGNDIPVTQATIKRERMEEILRDTIETDRQRRGEPVAWIRNERGGYEGKEIFDPLVILGSAPPIKTTNGATYSPVFAAPQPTEPVKRKRRYAQGTALGEYGVIPMCDQVDDEPVVANAPVPSDDVLADALYNLEHDNYEQSYSGYKNRQADLGLIRALLARCRAAQPAASADPTDPGHDVEVLREHVRHLERRIRQLHAANVIPVPTTKAEYIALLDMAIELGKNLNIAWEDALRASGQPAAPVAQEPKFPVPWPKREDITQDMRDGFERLYEDARKSNCRTLERTESGAYRNLRVHKDWLFYQRAWADAIKASTPVAQELQQVDDAAVSAIQFALQADEGLAWLRCWNEGDFDACRKWWPDAPEECFIGADPLHPGTKAALSAAHVAKGE